MWQLSKEYHFSAAHQLHGLDPDHPCMRQHGHNYRIVIELGGEKLDESGMLVDYLDLNCTIGKWIDDTLDHKDLNEVFPDMHTTAERLAQAIFNQCLTYNWGGFVTSVVVCETPKTTATYYGALTDES